MAELDRPRSEVIGYAPGAFDLFHVGHLNLLSRAREHCDTLVVGVVADEVLVRTKGVRPFVPLEDRVQIVAAIGMVDQVHVEHTADKLDAWAAVGFQRLFKGDDWAGTTKGRVLEERLGARGVEVVYFGYTGRVSSTALRRAVATRHHGPTAARLAVR
jgi:glycerol-3-phosphate cytidylyltransferase